MNHLARKAVAGFVQLVGGLAVLIFAPAGTFDYWQGWVFLFVFGGSCALIFAYLWKYDRNLLARRVRGGPGAEKERSQKWIQGLASIGFAGLLIVPALDRRLGWSDVPASIAIAGDAMVALGFLAILIVFRENSFAASTIEVAPGQKVVSTGPYAIVRHPMYSSALAMLFGMPLALGSWWGLLVFVPFAPVLGWRLLDEETFLSKNLPGYDAYCREVRYRLVPGIW